LIDIITAAGIGGISGVSSGALLLFILKSLETNVKNNTANISKLKSDVFNAIETQEDCWEGEIKKVQGQIVNANTKLDRVITVMQMQATNAGHPELVEILKNGGK